MKKGFLVLIFTLECIISVFAQSNIKYRKIKDDGNLSIMTEEVILKERGQSNIGIALMYETSIKESKDSSGLSLIITFLSYNDKTIMPLNGRLLIKTSSDKVITLSQIAPDGVTVFNPSTGQENEHYLKSAWYGNSMYKKIGKYPIGDEDLNSILSDGIIKIRLETTGGILEWEYPIEESIRIDKKKEMINLPKAFLLYLYSGLSNCIDPYKTFLQ